MVLHVRNALFKSVFLKRLVTLCMSGLWHVNEIHFFSVFVWEYFFCFVFCVLIILFLKLRIICNGKIIRYRHVSYWPLFGLHDKMGQLPTNNNSRAANRYAGKQSERFHAIHLHIMAKQTWWQGDRCVSTYISFVQAQKGETYGLWDQKLPPGGRWQNGQCSHLKQTVFMKIR